MAVGVIEPQNFPPEAQKILATLGPVVFPDSEDWREETIVGLFCRLGVYLGKNYLDAFTNLSWIASPTTSLSHIDNEYLLERGIRVYSLRNLEIQALQKLTSTAELTVFLTLAIGRNYLNLVNTGSSMVGWNRYAHQSEQLTSQKIGIIGLGRIGSRVYATLSAMGVNVVGFDVRNVSTTKFRPTVVNSIETLLGMSDIVILCASHAPAKPQILSREKLKAGKLGFKLVNTSRGELVDEEAIAELIRNGHMSGYATDVIAGEPQDKLWGSPILQLLEDGYNVVHTPHIGGAGSDALSLSETMLVEHVVAEIRAERK